MIEVRILSMLNRAVYPLGIFTVEGSEQLDIDDGLICFRSLVGKERLPSWVMEMADVVYMERTGQLLKHRFKPID